MTITLPDLPQTERLTPEQIRLELACALYARGIVGKVGGAELAGVDFFSFQRALGERQISTYTAETLRQELENMKLIFREDSAPADGK